MPKPATRQHQLAAIHIAQKALCLTDDDAAALKVQLTGQSSSAKMTSTQRSRLLAHLSGLQDRAARERGETPAYTPKPLTPQRAELYRSIDDASDDRWGKARALWCALAAAGVVHTPTDAALMAYIKRQTHVEHWRFLHGYQVNAVIESLKKWCDRSGVQHT